MKLRFPINITSAILGSVTYISFTILAYSQYPLSFSPARNWLSDLGNQVDNPQGAIYYNFGVILTALFLAIWFTAGLSQWRLKHHAIHRRLLTISQSAGILAAFALVMSALNPINIAQVHSFWCQVHFMMFSMGFGFSVAALRYHLHIPRVSLYLGAGAALLPTLMLAFGKVFWLEWVAVGLFIIYILSIGKASLTIMNVYQTELGAKKWGYAETVFVIWVGLALVSLIPVTIFLKGSIPLFTFVWLVVPLLVVLRTRVAKRVGFRKISQRAFLITTAINLSFLLLIAILMEPWSHAYQALVKGAMLGTSPDTTFAWLVRFKGLTAWGGLLFYSGLVTIFAEELFFRGWLLQSLQRRMTQSWAIVIQATLFTIPQLLVALWLSPMQGVVYAVMYSWLAIGMVGGWAAARTQTIWPSLASATIWNAIMIAWVL